MPRTAQYYCVALSLLISHFSFAQLSRTDSAKILETVVVTGQFSPQSLKQSVYKVRIINQERIRARAATDLAGVLNNEAGIRFSNDFALGETDISIMGMSGQNVKILLDGVPMIDRGSYKQSLGQLDVNTVERIEIVEGPMSVIYGTDALAGVINIVTEKPKMGTSALSVAARVQEETVGGTYSPFSKSGVHNEHVSASWSKGNWSANAYFTRNSFGGFRDTAIYPTKEWKPKDQWLPGASIGYRNARLNAFYRLDYLNEDIFAAGLVNTNNYKALDQHFITNRFTHQLQGEWQIDTSLKLNAALSYQDYKRKTESYDIDYRAGTETPTDPSKPGNEGQWDINRFKTLFLRTTLHWKVSQNLSLQPGMEIKSDQTSGGRVASDPTIRDYSLFASAEYKPAEFVTLRPGIRFSKNSVYDAPPVIPSINAKIALTNSIDLRASYARGFRSPILRELYFLFRDGNHDIQGNTALKAEYSNNYQVSISWQPSTSNAIKFSTALSGFYNDFRNRIELAAIPNSTVFTYINVARYKTTGATIENSFSYGNFSATVNASYIGRFNELSDDAAYKADDLPTFTWSPEIGTSFLYNFKKSGIQTGLFYKYTGRLPSYQVLAGSSSPYVARLELYHWADLTISKTLLKYITIQAGIKNLFDVTRLQSSLQTGGSAHSSAGPVLTGYGRSYFLGMAFQWDKK